MAQANITSDKWVLDADLEGQKQEQSIRVSYACASCLIVCADGKFFALLYGVSQTIRTHAPGPCRHVSLD